MTVAKLIEKLKEMPQDAVVVDLWNGTTEEPCPIFYCELYNEMVVLS